MWTHIEDTEPKARKPYLCCLCERRIQKGEKHVRRFGFDDTGPYATRMHTKCESLTRDWDADVWEDISPWTFRQEELKEA